MAFIQMKMVATSIIHNYKIEVVKGQQVVPSDTVNEVWFESHGIQKNN